MSRVFCFLALLLSAVSLCVTADTGSESVPLPDDGRCPDGYTRSGDGKNCSRTSPPAIPPPPPPPPHLPQLPGGKPCVSDDSIPQCSISGCEDEAARQNCGTSTGSETCNTNEPKKEDSCRDGSVDTHCTHSLQEPARSISKPQENGQVPGNPGPIGAPGEPGEGVTGAAGPGGVVSSSSLAPGPTPTPPAAPQPPERSVVESSVDGQTGSNGNNTTRESENGDNNGITATQPSADSSNTSPRVSGDGSDNTTAESGTTPVGSESTNNQEGVGNADPTTTTTTTTLPPELTNNKKGDADSSSSISSSVWVRVPLLIVVVLFSVAVY
ncbi:uncharacterized protein TM35_000621090 [Trypanosoma theileri]|uniref:Uncharacterized protein n=1 Tax=Trypanosoma theileri TaxID=67003 RepID=A0A1X0NG01_9TRYP|nr:uncharacterized protein TM35_000621090 [Trypanosoma theileri]ORC83635.1 hypothetical protein TM35_000621090 [Trypanosoma theileri]